MEELQVNEVYNPTQEESQAIQEVIKTFGSGQSTLNRGYDYFNGNNLLEAIDDWTKRWNGYIPPANPLLDQTQSQIFINFTRNAIISYLAKVAMSPVRAKVTAVNKKSGLPDREFAQLLKDLKDYSEHKENAEAKFMAAGLECATKGTVIVYEGYLKQKQKVDIPVEYDSTTGKVKTKKEERIIFDDCFQEIVPLEDFYITNPFQPDVQKQPKIIWRRLTSNYEAKSEFGHYKNWKYVVPGRYIVAQDATTFYRETLLTSLGKDQVEILRYYNRGQNRHIILANGVILYDGPIPFKDGMYPFAKTINEPFAVDFFWGNGHPNKYMGEQDLINSFINMMADKTFNSLAPTGLSSDLDDLIDDEVIQIGKIRKVSDIEKWKWWDSPDVTSGEQAMFNTVLGLARESAATDAGSLSTPRGGKVQTRQVMLKQQEVMQKLSFNMQFLEDLERDRSILRINHILQFYAIPKIEKITGKRGKEIQKLVFRDVNLNTTKLSDGREGNKVIKIISDENKNPDELTKLKDQLSILEVMGEDQGIPTEALAVSIDTFEDYNFEVEVVKNSSFERNQALDQAARLEFANWRLSLAQIAPLDIPELIAYVEEAFDIDANRFENKNNSLQPQPQQIGQQGQKPGMTPMQQLSPSNTALQSA